MCKFLCACVWADRDRQAGTERDIVRQRKWKEEP